MNPARAHFLSQGYVLARGLLPRNELDALGALVTAVHQSWLRDNEEACRRERLVNMHTLTDRSYFSGDMAARRRLFNAIASPVLAAWVRQVAGDGLYFHNTQLFFNPAGARQPYWHRDLQFSPIDDAAQAAAQSALCSLHVRIPLLREKGLALIPGTHRRWDTPLEADVRYSCHGRRDSDELPGAVVIECEPGDVLLFDAQMIHRGIYADNPARLAFDLCLARPHPFLRPFLDAAALPEESDMAQLDEPEWYRLALLVASGSAS